LRNIMLFLDAIGALSLVYTKLLDKLRPPFY
jgi:hypothetical protein